MKKIDMKKIITLASFALLVNAGLEAQTVYDAVKFTSKDLTGTARFVGMGGAMGALGGDVSTIGTNPAGIGIYRSHDVSTTFDLSFYETESKYNGSLFKNNRNRFTVDNAGFVFASKIGDNTPLRFVNFGFNYKRSKSFYKNMSMEGLVNMVNGYAPTQTTQMTNQANSMYNNGYDIAKIEVNSNIFDHNQIGWLAALGWDGYLIDVVNNGYGRKVNIQPYSTFKSKETGGIDQYDFNVALNFEDRYYFGLTIGAYDVNYKKYSFYDEDYANKEGYNLQSWNRVTGSGFDFKLGAIVRPFEYSPLRIGLAIHTPTFYKLTHETSARLEYDIDKDNNGTIVSGVVDTQKYLEKNYSNGDMALKYRLQTPWKYNLSLGYTVGNNLALGAEYEYEDYSTMKFRYPDDGEAMAFENSTAKEMLRGINTFRIGAEYKFVPEFAFRIGYNYSTAAFTNRAWKDLPNNSIYTDTDYANTKAISNYTFGFGYRGKYFYSDIACKLNNYKEDFYAFYDAEKYGARNDLAKTKVTNTNYQVLFTMGVRF